MSVQAFVPGTGRGVQGATSHCLGQNFAKMCDIMFEDKDEKRERKYVWQNSWGLSTRSVCQMYCTLCLSSGGSTLVQSSCSPLVFIVEAFLNWVFTCSFGLIFSVFTFRSGFGYHSGSFAAILDLICNSSGG